MEIYLHLTLKLCYYKLSVYNNDLRCPLPPYNVAPRLGVMRQGKGEKRVDTVINVKMVTVKLSHTVVSNCIQFVTSMEQRNQSESPTGIEPMTFRTPVGCSN